MVWKRVFRRFGSKNALIRAVWCVVGGSIQQCWAIIHLPGLGKGQMAAYVSTKEFNEGLGLPTALGWLSKRALNQALKENEPL